MEITAELVKELVAEQFPQWKNPDVRPVEKSGHDNRTFHLGEALSVRLPSGKAYEAQVKKESTWLPYLQKHLDYPISAPLAVGRPSRKYPYFWSVNRWIEGRTLLEEDSVDREALARDLSAALKKLQRIDCTEGPQGGQHNFYRGCSPTTYHADTVAALNSLRDELPVSRLPRIWENSVRPAYQKAAVWVHGDVAPGNILMKNRRFYGLIDFGILGTGDPACDYAMAWTYFDGKSRSIFLENLDAGMIARARGWALWKALITYKDSDPDFRSSAEHTITEILKEAEPVAFMP